MPGVADGAATGAVEALSPVHTATAVEGVFPGAWYTRFRRAHTVCGLGCVITGFGSYGNRRAQVGRAQAASWRGGDPVYADVVTPVYADVRGVAMWTW